MHPTHRVVAAAIVIALELVPVSGSAQQFASRMAPRDVAPANPFATIQGNALTATDAALPNALVRLRDARRGRIMEMVRTDHAGVFTFLPVDPGSYVAELVDREQIVLAASELVNVNAGDVVSVIVRLPFRMTPYAALFGPGKSSAVLVTATAAAAGVLGIQVTGHPVSPRR